MEDPLNLFGIFPSTWKILIIDDDEDDRILIREMLKEAEGRKFEVHYESTYEAGRKAIFSNSYDAVLIDYDLGAHTGIELIREANAHGYAAPFILFTGRGSYEVDVEAMQAGATLYLTKGEANSLLLERAIRYAIELKQKAQALQVSEERFQKAFDASPNAQVISRPEDGRIETINNSFEQLFGYHREEVLGKTSLELKLFANPGDRQEAVHRLRMGNSLRNFELDIRTKSGDIRQACLSVEMISIGQERLMLTVIDDITERKQAETALRKSETRLSALISASAQVLYRMSPDWREMRQLQGGSFLADTEKPNPNWMAEYIHPDDQPWVREVIENAVQTGTVFELEHRVLRADGTLGWTASRAVPVRNAEGEIVEWFGAASNITERKQSEQRLQEANLLLHEVIAGSPDLIAAMDKDFRYLAVNPAYQSAFKLVFGKEVQAGTSILEALADAPEELQNAKDLWERALQGERIVTTSEFGSPGHARRIFEMRFYPIRDAEGKVIAAGEIANDVTERLQMEQALQSNLEKLARSNEAMVQFAFLASHDLQEPLRKIITFGDNLRRHASETLDQEANEYLERMQSDARRMHAMIEGLLELSQVTIRSEEYVPIRLTRVVKQVVSDLEPRIKALEGQVFIDDLPAIEADALQMHQLFQYLIGNAIKFHRPGVAPQVRVSGKIRPGIPAMVEIRIEDNGIGFNQHHEDRIFHLFTRLHGQNEYEGTGLGLAVCQKIVERHRGTIEVQSNSGQGSTFTILLPIKPSE